METCLALLLALSSAASAFAAPRNLGNAYTVRGKLDHELTRSVGQKPTESSRVIVTLQPGAQLPPELQRLVTKSHRSLGILNAVVLTVPNRLLRFFEAHPAVLSIDLDRPIGTSNFRTALTIGSRPVQSGLGLTGAGVGVAIIDSGIATWHDDLTVRNGQQYPYGNQRVSAFVDFVNGQTTPYDDEGHGTHVAGIIAGNGYDSFGQKAGVAPDASLVSLKVLDVNGGGTISNIIAAFDWIVANHTQYNIRVVNASVGAGIHESYLTDPLTLAAKRVVDAGVVVVAAAGNVGMNAAGQTQYGGITAPGNAPWVITVGASSTMGTPARGDDTIASFSSRGPTYKDFGAKPDLVAPGVGTVSLAAPLSTFYTTKAQYLLPGSISTAQLPYLALSGTSMAAPVVAGTVALMMQANPALTPNLAKAILEYTAQPYGGYDPLTQGAGFLNALGAVRLAEFYATAQPGDHVPTQSIWGRRITWGNHRVGLGMIRPNASAYRATTTWGARSLDDGGDIVWGTACDTSDCSDIVWGTNDSGDIVWGTSCTDADCSDIVWGTADDDNVVWGTDCGGDDCGNIVWGTASDDENIVWGTADEGDIVWGTAADDGDIVWGTSDDSDIVWGTDDDGNIVWGTDDIGDIVWGTSVNGVTTWYGANGNVQGLSWAQLLPQLTDDQVLALLGSITTTAMPPPPPPPVPPNQSMMPPIGGGF